MMTPVKVRNIVIGEGMPKICVPLVGVTRDEILAEARALASLPADVAEWRADWFAGVSEPGAVLDVLHGLREALGDTALLVTFRTAKEGGERAIDAGAYEALAGQAARSGCVDLIDVELFMGEELVSRIIGEAHALGVKVIASSHDFEKTPGQEELVSRMRKMQTLGADILKIAVMPQSKKDVLTLLAATEEMYRAYADRPIVTMSMARDGVISRLCGEVFGSALTFGAASRASAPGQMDAGKLRTVLELLHGAMA